MLPSFLSTRKVLLYYVFATQYNNPRAGENTVSSFEVEQFPWSYVGTDIVASQRLEFVYLEMIAVSEDGKRTSQGLTFLSRP